MANFLDLVGLDQEVVLEIPVLCVVLLGHGAAARISEPLGKSLPEPIVSHVWWDAADPVCYFCRLPYGSFALCQASLIQLPFGQDSPF